MRKDAVKTLIMVPLFLVAFGTVNFIFLGKAHLCVFRACSGLPCPGCGLTHAGLALLNLNWRESLRCHALFIPIALTLAFGCIPSQTNKYADLVNKQHWWHYALLTLSIVYFVFRCLCFERAGAYPMCYDPDNYLELFCDLF